MEYIPSEIRGEICCNLTWNEVLLFNSTCRRYYQEIKYERFWSFYMTDKPQYIYRRILKEIAKRGILWLFKLLYEGTYTNKMKESCILKECYVSAGKKLNFNIVEYIINVKNDKSENDRYIICSVNDKILAKLANTVPVELFDNIINNIIIDDRDTFKMNFVDIEDIKKAFNHWRNVLHKILPAIDHSNYTILYDEFIRISHIRPINVNLDKILVKSKNIDLVKKFRGGFYVNNCVHNTFFRGINKSDIESLKRAIHLNKSNPHSNINNSFLNRKNALLNVNGNAINMADYIFFPDDKNVSEFLIKETGITININYFKLSGINCNVYNEIYIEYIKNLYELNSTALALLKVPYGYYNKTIEDDEKMFNTLSSLWDESYINSEQRINYKNFFKHRATDQLHFLRILGRDYLLEKLTKLLDDKKVFE